MKLSILTILFVTPKLVSAWRLTILSYLNKDTLFNLEDKIKTNVNFNIQKLQDVFFSDSQVLRDSSDGYDIALRSFSLPLKYSYSHIRSFWNDAVVTNPSLRIAVDAITETRQLNGIDYNNGELIAMALLSYSLVGAMNGLKNKPITYGEPYGESIRYDPDEARKYFKNKPLLKLLRSIEIVIKSSSFGLNILIDKARGDLFDPEKEKIRSNQACDLLTSLGPTFIKVGQSLSIRTDLLRPAYIEALTKLQDKVPSFSTVVSREIIAKELQTSVDDIFVEGLGPSSSTIAAASLGQVFKAKLKNGEYVAVKVQRPSIIENVALDMHLLREAAPILKNLFNLNSDLAGIVDNWGRGFVDELDYRREADNAAIFTKSIASSPLSDLVFAPEVLYNYSSRKVLTTKWVDGERLELSSSDDINKLCSVALSTYLTMLLDCPILHCDPHPGNLRRTPEGKLCIMDWGLTTSIPPDLQVTFIEHVAHLVSRDYASVPADLVKLGFVPEGKESVILSAGVVDVLADIYGKWAKGGGAAKIGINKVVSQLNKLTTEFGNIFQLPPYFAYVARAFAVLEGIGLTNDPDFAILNECLPYISQRLLIGTDAKTEGALNTFIFGKEKDNSDRVLDPERLRLLLKGVNKYSRSMDGLTVASKADSKSSSEYIIVGQIDRIADGFFDIIFKSKDGTDMASSSPTPIQKVIIEELGKLIGASSRRTWSQIRSATGKLNSGRTLLGTVLDPIGLFSGSSLIEFDAQDERVLTASSNLVVILQEYLPKSDSSILKQLDSQMSLRIAQVLLEKVWVRRNELQKFSWLILSEILQQTARRAEHANAARLFRGKVSSNPKPIVPLPPLKLADENSSILREDVDTILAKKSKLSEVTFANYGEEEIGENMSLSRIDKARAMLQAVRREYAGFSS